MHVIPPDPAAALLMRCIDNPICYAVVARCPDCATTWPLTEPMIAHTSCFDGEYLIGRCAPCGERFLRARLGDTGYTQFVADIQAAHAHRDDTDYWIPLADVMRQRND